MQSDSHKTSDKDLQSVIFDSISGFTSICFHDGPNYIRDPSTRL